MTGFLAVLFIYVGLGLACLPLTLESFSHISYTWKHFKAFNDLQDETFGYWKYKFHDIDKILMYIFIPFVGTKMIKKIHKRISKHHVKPHTKSKKAIEEALIDWECAQYTKSDKQGNAYWTIHKKERPKWQKDLLLRKLEKLNRLNPKILLKSNR